MLIASHWTDHGVSSGGVRERTEGAEEVCNPIGRTKISTNQTSPEFPGAKPPTKEYIHMEGPMAPAAYVAEDDLVWHQWEERPFVL